MTNKYHNEQSISTYACEAECEQGLAFVACNQPASAIRDMLQRCGVPMRQAIFLSPKDDPGISTPKAIFAALPLSITWVLIADVEFLLPRSQRTRRAVHALMGEFGRLAHPRGIVVNATHGLGSPPASVVSVHSLTGGEA